MVILITGGAGFIGSNLIHYWLEKHPDDTLVNFDALTYAGNPANLAGVESNSNYHFFHGDLRKKEQLDEVFERYSIDAVIHLAAESHVDRSINDPSPFIETNINGTFHLLEVARKHWQDDLKSHRFVHVSTDEVYGSLGKDGIFTEETPFAPNSPYSSSKASSDHLVRAWHHTFGMDILVTHCSNNYGPFQFPEKLIPLMIRNCIHQDPLPVYGDGLQIRDWLYVEDHCEALDFVFHKGESGETYNIGGLNEWENLSMVRHLCEVMDSELGNSPEKSCLNLIRHIRDRPGHDRRYAIDASKICKQLGWKPRHQIREGLEKTLRWYLDHQDWVEQVTSGAYRDYYRKHYGTD
ncbi:MAG: dTDP-glucose 4,6-dehydratase [SAR324 cluster bacterium]|jgi:dTDP-glucose 4,6-dehydratase|nr:dTDP-glucose 4,6-dehydratase [SAR324 cluster bacterium]HCP35285.1 dTDP-glucose 4,6-dehydratase [Deltaproteobacteria bacterium]MDP6331372.1 dTDP-glucose 4,6-dehydratase [SAR324 cluster bacterium]MDP6464830.1 dTDP-glucose 4,6-dehydratase [SAR324 cluster bacterium]MDP6638989.1 dTDP-glucose 4,6-dehydratase [SAR324 cluster bacterium]|tara:strand:- start:5629 stop:6681 length:1053 start_codon:yes stop_codon:yes gene_type:complete